MSNADKLTTEERVSLGKEVRGNTENLLIRCYAASIIDEGYPLPATSCTVLFDGYTDEQLGYRFAKWCDRRDGNASA